MSKKKLQVKRPEHVHIKRYLRDHKTLSYFIRESITVQLVSSFTGLDSTRKENMFYLCVV